MISSLVLLLAALAPGLLLVAWLARATHAVAAVRKALLRHPCRSCGVVEAVWFRGGLQLCEACHFEAAILPGVVGDLLAGPRRAA